MKTWNQVLNKLLFAVVFMGITAQPLMALTDSSAPILASGCTDDKFVNGGEFTEIMTTGSGYTPKCLRVKVGATVSIQASARHPLIAMASLNGDSANNPFAADDKATETQTRQLLEPGVFGFFCASHGKPDGTGMVGIIIVEE